MDQAPHAHTDRSWRPAPERVTLGSREVHVWRVSLDQPPERVISLEVLLSDDEVARTKRFYFERHQRDFIVARGFLREILARYLSADPKAVQFQYAAYGKPSVAGPSADSRIRFNVSHSHRIALYAVTYGREIGVDIEFIRPGVATEGIADRFFSPQEISCLFSLPPNLREEAFFNCWTRKEAYIKALGEGLSMPLHLFDVSLAPGEPATLLSTRPDPDEASRWSLLELAPGPGYVAALAVEGVVKAVHTYQLS